eukprot:SAG22_NODE_1436_length_4421_cov_9.840583_2_plen_113_part_00
MDERYGRTVHYGKQYGGAERHLAEVWAAEPQPISLKVRCARAVRDKVPRGRYAVHVSIYDRLGGYPITRLGRNHGPEKVRRRRPTRSCPSILPLSQCWFHLCLSFSSRLNRS